MLTQSIVSYINYFQMDIIYNTLMLGTVGAVAVGTITVVVAIAGGYCPNSNYHNVLGHCRLIANQQFKKLRNYIYPTSPSSVTRTLRKPSQNNIPKYVSTSTISSVSDVMPILNTDVQKYDSNSDDVLVTNTDLQDNNTNNTFIEDLKSFQDSLTVVT